MMNEEEMDNSIRALLKGSHRAGMLSNVALETGIAGGEETLIDIMNSTEPMHSMDRGMLGITLLGIAV